MTSFTGPELKGGANWAVAQGPLQLRDLHKHIDKTALKRCTSTETLWNRKAPSLSSPEDEEIFLPKLPRSWHADVFKGPKVSTEIGASLGIDWALLLLKCRS